MSLFHCQRQNTSVSTLFPNGQKLNTSKELCCTVLVQDGLQVCVMLCIICNYNYKVKEVQGFDEINYWFELNDFTYALQVWLDQGNNVGSDIVNQVKQRKTSTASLPPVTLKTNGLMDHLLRPCLVERFKQILQGSSFSSVPLLPHNYQEEGTCSLYYPKNKAFTILPSYNNEIPDKDDLSSLNGHCKIATNTSLVCSMHVYNFNHAFIVLFLCRGLWGGPNFQGRTIFFQKQIPVIDVQSYTEY